MRFGKLIRSAKVIVAIFFISAGGIFGAGSDLTPADGVVLVVNSADPESALVAEHYAEMRHVPVKNIYAFPMPRTEEISRAEFVREIWQPLQDVLVRDHWVDGIPMGGSAVEPRRRYAMNGHRVTALVVCRGVPLKIRDTPEFAPPPEMRLPAPELRTSAAAVDSELALLAANFYPELGTVPNVLFQREKPSALERGQVITVSRLDGPNLEATQALVDHAVEAEQRGIFGRAYIDLSGRHADGDRWLEVAGRQLSQAGFETQVDRASPTFAIGARADAPIFYFGWYAENIDGPFSLPNYRFPPGAIALHIHSFSAHTLRSTTAGWSGPLVAHGVAVTFGNVYEPYLHLTVRPDLFVRALLSGMSAGEAYVFAMPVWSWQGILLGDPLYRPWSRPLARMWNERASLPPEARAYLYLEKIQLAENAHDQGLAEALAETCWQEDPSLPLAVSLGERAAAGRNLPRARAAMRAAANFSYEDATEWGLAHTAAEFLSQNAEPGPARKIYEKLFAQPLPRALHASWLNEAAEMLREIDPATSARWTQERNELIPPAK